MKKLKLKMKLCDIKHTIESCVLCIRFPFLYTRNRFSGEHYTNWKLRGYLMDLGLLYESKITINVDPIPESEIKEFTCPRGKVNNHEYYANVIGDSYFLRLPDDSLLPITEFVEGKVYGIDCKDASVTVYCAEDANIKKRFSFYTIAKDPIYKFFMFLIKILYFFSQLFHCIPTYTELDAMPSGWRKAFGIQMCKEIKRALKKIDYLHKYQITQIKEKYGQLRWYDAGANKEIYDIIAKYEVISERTCIHCGKPAKWISRGWISPYCDDCIGDKDYADSIEEVMNIKTN